jgi:secretion/DNA translocation related TadE-like protein
MKEAPGGFRRDADQDTGVATVWAAAAVSVVLVIAVLGINLGAAISGRHRAAAAADLAALAAASHVADGEVTACAHSVRVTDGMAAQLTSCRVSGWEAFVEVEIRPPVPLLPVGVARGRARAGPAQG